MSQCKLPPYILQELPDITENIYYPLKNVQRIKYTCFDVSKSLIAFGATSGGIYVFNRSPCEFTQLIPNKDGAITRVAISVDEKHIAFANGRGQVTVTKCDQSLSGGHSTVVNKEHQGNEVTALVWSGNMLFTGDDVGKISVLQFNSFIAKTMFQSSSQTIMSLDSRICQIDVKDCMLLVSTLTRCYICDTSQEQYRQIGQKLRDGEFGACFVNTAKNLHNGTDNVNVKDITEVKKYAIVDDGSRFAVCKDLENTLIYCARPSSRLWESNIDGTVRRTHQFKQVLGRKPMKVVTLECYDKEICNIEVLNTDNDGQSVNFTKIFSLKGAIFSFKRDSLYLLNVINDDDTVWFDYFKDIVDCKMYQDYLYLWLGNGSIINLRLMKIDKFLLKSYLDEKYVLCAQLCALYCDYLLSNNVSSKLHILVGLKEKIQDADLLQNIEELLQKFDSLKSDATQMKSGIYVVDNTYNAQSCLSDEDSETKHVHGDHLFGPLSPEAIQTLKGISVTVSDTINSSKKMLKEKWDGFEGKMKNLSTEKSPEVVLATAVSQESNGVKLEGSEDVTTNINNSVEDTAEQIIQEVDEPKDQTPIVYSNDINKESSQKAIEIDSVALERDRVCKSLFQHFRISVVDKDAEQSNLIYLIECYACDINEIYKLMLQLEEYCLSINALDESKFVPNHIFLNYLNLCARKDVLLDAVIENETLYKYFVNSCVIVNLKTQKLSNMGCECGFPLPYTQTKQTPVFSELIDRFIEKQWLSQTRDQCYEICKKMPYLWKKMLYLRRNEDLMNVLRILLQMLDENLIHSFLPQFTLDIWHRTIQLYATLHANICLNCGKKFEHISVKETLSWDDIGALMIKSVGGKTAVRVMEKHASLIDPGELSIKFYHTCLLAALFEKYDASITSQLVDALYSAYDFEDSRKEICNLLRNTLTNQLKNTALPLITAAKTIHWGLKPFSEKILLKDGEEQREKILIQDKTVTDIIDNIEKVNNGVTDCLLCGLPLQNEVLIRDGGLWVFKCGHTFHGPCLDINKIKLCPSCSLS